MATLKIQVLGKGMIPRGLGLAPRKNPFPADYFLIGTILSTPGLSVRYINPETGVPTDLTKASLKKVWDKYSEYVAPAKVSTPDVTVPTTPVTPEVKTPEVKTEAKVETPVTPEPELKPVVNEEKEAPVTEAPVEDIKPVTNPAENKNNQQNQNNNKNQNNSNKNNNQNKNNH